MKSPVLNRKVGKAAHLETSKVSFKKILVATDFSPVADKALEAGAALAQQYGAELYVANVIAPAYYPNEGSFSSAKVLECEESAAWAAMLRLSNKHSVRRLRHHEIVRFGSPIETIEELINEFGIDLLVAGTHGAKGFEKIVLGSVAETLLRECSCPVLTIGPHATMAREGFRSILVPTALTPESLRANQYAVSLAETDNANLTLLYVIEDKPPLSHELGVEMRRALKDRLRELVPEDADAWCRPHYRVEYGSAATEILETAHEVKADLIVLGPRHAKAMADHAPWSTVSKVIANAKCPVLTVKGHFTA